MKPMPRIIRRWLLLLLALFSFTGCGPDAQITTQRAPKPDVEPIERRTLGAIALHGDEAWFFKVTGLEERVQNHEAAFRDFVSQVKFDAAGDPQWKLPNGWRENPGDSFRYRTLLMSADTSPLELTVSKLPLGKETTDQTKYVLDNINRWRKQLDLSPLDADQLDREAETVKLASDEPVWFVNFVGTGSGSMAPPMASSPGASSPGSAAPPSSDTAAGNTAAELAYDTPEGWKAAGAGGMRLAAFTIENDSQKAEVTVIPLGPAAGDLLDNVNRWRGQIQLPPLDAAELAEQTRTLDVSGAPGTYVVLEGPESQTPRQSILGVILPRSDRVWFIKMTGDAALVAREQPRFEQFAQSLRLP